MRLFSQNFALLVFASTLACQDPTAPQGIDAMFVLERVNNQQLPVDFSVAPAQTTTILSATLTLDRSGKAVMIENRREVYQGFVTTPSYTSVADYRINGDRIEIGSFKPCPPGALCIANRFGTISDLTLDLTVGQIAPSTDIVYNFQRKLPAAGVQG